MKSESESPMSLQVPSDTEQKSQQLPEREEDTQPKFTPEEREKSKRIFKSATPKYTFDWYVKWVSSVLLLTAMAIRAAQYDPFLDLCLSLTGMIGWIYVSLVWKDRAMIMLNGVATFILAMGLLNHLAG